MGGFDSTMGLNFQLNVGMILFEEGIILLGYDVHRDP
jgi:hypothetical protein